MEHIVVFLLDYPNQSPIKVSGGEIFIRGEENGYERAFGRWQ